ncbi:MAG: glycosyltransferase family 4 protein [Patescibacteria group bacterium]
MPSIQNKPEILLVVDWPNWALDSNVEGMRPYLEDVFTLTKKYQAEIREEDVRKATIVVIFYFQQLSALPILQNYREKILLGICSHVELAGPDRERKIDTINTVVSGVFVISKLLEREFEHTFTKPLFYTPMGVNTKFFFPKNRLKRGITSFTHKRKLRVGWAGSISNHGDTLRGLSDYIIPAIQGLKNVELKIAAREERWRSSEEMRNYYHSLDAYICASKSEGTPNPCLEAAATGVPIITTRVGNMPEFIQDGINGFFITRSVEDIRHKLTLLQTHRLKRIVMSYAATQGSHSWDWERQAENYRAMFEALLKKRIS